MPSTDEGDGEEAMGKSGWMNPLADIPVVGGDKIFRLEIFVVKLL
jgi:hypothetical protein